MKKVHNTRSKDRETIALLQMTMPEKKKAETTLSSAISSASTTHSTSSDWMEIMECEIAAIELQRQHEVDNNLMTVFDVKGSENLCDKQLGGTILPDLQISELAAQETIVVDQDVNIERETTLSGLEEAQLNTYTKEAVSTVIEESNQKNDNRSYDQHTLMNNGTKDTMQPMEDDRFIENQETPKPTLWKLNPRILNNPFISKKIVADLRDREATSDWDYYKVQCQSIYRACKPPTAPETRIQKIHKRLTELNNKMARNPQLTDLSIVVAQL
ncbi:741_t:CDS:2, partial [Gigaspora margarita]